MWAGSDRLFSCLTNSSQQIRTKAEVIIDGDVALTITGKTVVDPVTGQAASMIDGTVQVDRAQISRQADITFLDLSAVPGDLTVTRANDLFAPLRTEIRLWRGYEYWDATPYEKMTGTGVEYWPLGTFILSKASMQWPKITLHGLDRLWNLRGKFQRPWVVTRGSSNMDELERILVGFIPANQLDYNLPVSSATTTAVLWDQQDDILTRANDLVVAEGRVLYADAMGTIRVANEAEVDDFSLPAWTFAPGRASISSTPEREVDATDAENVVVASGESDGTVTPVTATAKDMNPASFTYVGKVPEVTRFYTSPLLTTQAQCALAARTILIRELGVSDTIVVPTVPLPGLENSDFIKATDPKVKVNDVLIADSFNIPLRASGLMTINCRTQRIS